MSATESKNLNLSFKYGFQTEIPTRNFNNKHVYDEPQNKYNEDFWKLAKFTGILRVYINQVNAKVGCNSI